MGSLGTVLPEHPSNGVSISHGTSTTNGSSITDAPSVSNGTSITEDPSTSNGTSTVNGISASNVASTNNSITSSTSQTTNTSQPPIPPSGVWAPAITFFDPHTDALDLSSTSAYYRYLSTTGLAGLVILGTNAETFLLTRSERKSLLLAAREACGPQFPLMAGVGGHGTAQVLEFVDDAVEAGMDYVLLLPPGYFGKQTTGPVVEGFFDEVAGRCPLPIVIYNFPAVVNGVDLDSATIARLAKRHANIVGVKLTCGAVAKVTRLAAELGPQRFAVFGGQSDFLVGALASGAAGTIAGFANVVPKVIVRIYNLWRKGMVKEALELHCKAALAEQGCKAGIATVKFAAGMSTARKAGIEGPEGKVRPRRPYLEPGEEEKRRIEGLIADVLEIEAGL